MCSIQHILIYFHSLQKIYLQDVSSIVVLQKMQSEYCCLFNPELGQPSRVA